MNDVNLVFVIVSVIAGLLVGLPAGAAGALALVQRANESKELKDSTEQLLASQVPADVVREINQTANNALRMMDQVFAAFKQGVFFIRDVTDGQPNTAGTPAPEAATSEEARARANR